MEEKYRKILEEYDAVEQDISAQSRKDPSNPVVRDLARKLKKLIPRREKVLRLEKIEKELAELKEISEDPQMRELCEAERKVKEKEREEIIAELEKSIFTHPWEGRDVIVEVRAGTGGAEASLFALDLFKMYQKVADRNGLSLEVLSFHEHSLGGIKEAIFEVKGEKAFYFFRFEGGVHRVQRVPSTEASGRIHTSAASVAVYPEPEEVDIKINPSDLRIDTFRSSGKGGQHVNKTDSAVRITHIPTGIVTSCQEERSQHQNKEKAMKILKARIFEALEEKREEDIKNIRRGQVKSQDRSQKIRTYNFPQGRVTDHRINLTLHYLQDFLNGNIDEMTEALWKNL